MKSILLTSTALVAFAGAAAADGHAAISFSGEATLGYNTNVDVNENAVAASEGFFWDSSVDVTMSAALDNGLTAEATFGFSVADNNLGQGQSTSVTDPLTGEITTTGDFVTTDFVVSLKSDTASLSFGDLDPVAEDRWGGVDGASVAGFNDQDVHFGAGGFESMLVGEATVAGFTAAVSFGVDGDGTTAEDNVDAMQLHVAGSFGTVDLELAYQQEFAGTPEIFGLSASTALAGADLTVAYIDDGTENSIGLAASYPVGPVTIGAYYSVNDLAEDNLGLELDYAANGIAVNAFYDLDGADNGNANDLGEDVASFGIEGSYDVGNGLNVFAGFLSTDVDDAPQTVYAAATYDLGGGAEILASYADDGVDSVVGEDLGDPEYKEGLTVEVSFEF